MQWELSLVEVVEEVLILQKRVVCRFLEERLLVYSAICVLRIGLLLTWKMLVVLMNFT